MLIRLKLFALMFLKDTKTWPIIPHLHHSINVLESSSFSSPSVSKALWNLERKFNTKQLAEIQTAVAGQGVKIRFCSAAVELSRLSVLLSINCHSTTLSLLKRSTNYAHNRMICFLHSSITRVGRS